MCGHIKNQQSQQAQPPLMHDETKETEDTTAEKSVAAAAQQHAKREVTEKRRCAVCNKKLPGMSYYTCACQNTTTKEKVFCSDHRMPETHACTYDHGAKWRTLIEKNNPLVVGIKVNTI